MICIQCLLRQSPKQVRACSQLSTIGYRDATIQVRFFSATAEVCRKVTSGGKAFQREVKIRQDIRQADSSDYNTRITRITPNRLATKENFEPKVDLITSIKKSLKTLTRSNNTLNKLEQLGIPTKTTAEFLKEYAALAQGVINTNWEDNPIHFPTRSQFQKSRRENGEISIERVIFRHMVTFASKNPRFSSDILRVLLDHAEMRYPSQWFPEARALKRTIYLHVGPTNSGKTYQALESLRKASSGAYLGPLRLLAHEIYNRLNDSGCLCNLQTGEEIRNDENANHYSCTIEMAPLTKTFDVVVIDEGQMISDPDRGHTWTAAILGAIAKEVHICGDPAMVPLIQKMAEMTKDELIVNRYNRLSPYSVPTNSLGGNFNAIKPGDCVISFSRTKIFQLKESIEQQTKLTCAVVYGSLPPEVRAMQANLFNKRDPKAQVLVASDAVGMGLNLKIQRVIFSTMVKFDGRKNMPLDIPAVKQIAGRAGRFDKDAENQIPGEATTLSDADLPHLKEAINAPTEYLKKANLAPREDHILAFCERSAGDLKILPSQAMMLLAELADTDDSIFKMVDLENQIEGCQLVENELKLGRSRGLNLMMMDSEILKFSLAPVNKRDDVVNAAFLAFVRVFAAGGSCALSDIVDLSPYRRPNVKPANVPESELPGPPRTSTALQNLESLHRITVLFLWLNMRFPSTFVSYAAADKIKVECEQIIQESLSLIGRIRKGRKVWAVQKRAAARAEEERILSESSMNNLESKVYNNREEPERRYDMQEKASISNEAYA